MNNTAKQWVGYLEHKTLDMIGDYDANVGKGYFTIFSLLIQRHYRWRSFFGLPWCATFIHAVCLQTYGKERAKKILGKPHPGTRVMARRLARKNRFMGSDYIPQSGDLIFLHNGDGRIGHCGIVDHVRDNVVVSIEGNSVDPSGHFGPKQGGAVSVQTRELTNSSIVGYGKIFDLK